MIDTSESQLIYNYLKGDEKSLEILINSYFKPIYRFIYHYVNNSPEAEDLTQEVFVRAWQNLSKFDQSKKFSTWLFTIAKNLALDFLKKKKALVFSEFEDELGNNSLIETLTDPLSLPDNLFDQANLAELLTAALAKLPTQDRVVVLLHYQDQLNFREISEYLNEPLNSIKSRWRRALIKLNQLLKIS
ncbi:MAG: sigma-70 family RNA polymerase sigma factor [Candidatus Komeilibacteria bacterium]|nr:sigma-70 family RNA polymerase sigma factor [Candidatus Komeilibacteria bacterium]